MDIILEIEIRNKFAITNSDNYIFDVSFGDLSSQSGISSVPDVLQKHRHRWSDIGDTPKHYNPMSHKHEVLDITALEETIKVTKVDNAIRSDTAVNSDNLGGISFQNYAYVHEHPYALTSHMHNYLPLSGGVISGVLTISSHTPFGNTMMKHDDDSVQNSKIDYLIKEITDLKNINKEIIKRIELLEKVVK